MSDHSDYFDKLNEFRDGIKRPDQSSSRRYLPKNARKTKERDLKMLNKRDVTRFFREKFERNLKEDEFKTLERFFERMCEAWHEDDLVEKPAPSDH